MYKTYFGYLQLFVYMNYKWLRNFLRKHFSCILHIMFKISNLLIGLNVAPWILKHFYSICWGNDQKLYHIYHNIIYFTLFIFSKSLLSSLISIYIIWVFCYLHFYFLSQCSSAHLQLCFYWIKWIYLISCDCW